MAIVSWHIAQSAWRPWHFSRASYWLLLVIKKDMYNQMYIIFCETLFTKGALSRRGRYELQAKQRGTITMSSTTLFLIQPTITFPSLVIETCFTYHMKLHYQCFLTVPIPQKQWYKSKLRPSRFLRTGPQLLCSSNSRWGFHVMQKRKEKKIKCSANLCGFQRAIAGFSEMIPAREAGVAQSKVRK